MCDSAPTCCGVRGSAETSKGHCCMRPRAPPPMWPAQARERTRTSRLQHSLPIGQHVTGMGAPGLRACTARHERGGAVFHGGQLAGGGGAYRGHVGQAQERRGGHTRGPTHVHKFTNHRAAHAGACSWPEQLCKPLHLRRPVHNIPGHIKSCQPLAFPAPWAACVLLGYASAFHGAAHLVHTTALTALMEILSLLEKPSAPSGQPSLGTKQGAPGLPG